VIGGEDVFPDPSLLVMRVIMRMIVGVVVGGGGAHGFGLKVSGIQS
jgi:hypothetical protein